jgi:hypothetical protein
MGLRESSTPTQGWIGSTFIHICGRASMADRAVGVIRQELAIARQRVAALEGALAALGGVDAAGVRATGTGKRPRRRKMSAAQKKVVSERMRKYWAKRKKQD